MNEGMRALIKLGNKDHQQEQTTTNTSDQSIII